MSSAKTTARPLFNDEISIHKTHEMLAAGLTLANASRYDYVNNKVDGLAHRYRNQSHSPMQEPRPRVISVESDSDIVA
jgi:hypothetical protein